ncbi:HAD family hydrolase [Dictyobacter aurantiacus]|uniref:Hydrolase n=1 Tax=Dictyobacter aurantiacus TaxID=1936993 RepID=A0A401ZL40_9CHLR|nr:HAD family phosphatase [Dictyobacter aurantiacus]GCE07563.1 hypothetical protein KDAU_48920 [Dictyobacter aurantiacus]
MAIRAVVFDIGGVLEITPANPERTIQWEARLGLQPGELNQRMEQVWHDGSLGRCSEEQVLESLKERVGMSQKQIAVFWQELWDEYLGQPNVELMEYFKGLRPAYRTAMLSNSFVGARAREQDRYHFDQLAEMIIYSHEVGVAKPERRIYELTCELLELQPAEVLLLDDAEANVLGARQCGMHAIPFQGNGQAIADINAFLRAASA